MQRFQTALRNKTVWQRVAMSNGHITRHCQVSHQVLLSVRAFSALPDHEVVGLPALSPTMDVGTIAKWNKQEGDLISAGDVVCEVETDKAVVDFEATDDSYLAKILVPAGSGEVAVGSPIFVTVMEKDEVAAFQDFKLDAASAVEASPAAMAVEAAPAPASVDVRPSTPAPVTATPTIASTSGRVFASPLAKKFARESGAVLSKINGSGPNGRIIKADVEAAVAAGSAAPKVETTTAEAAAADDDDADAAAPTAAANYTDYPISSEAQTIAQQFTQQKRDVPHYHLSTNLMLDKLLDARARLNADRGDDEQLSVNDFIVRAASLAMRKVPEANSSWKGSFIRQYNDVDVNLMVSSGAGGGVLAPVLTRVNRKGLDDISKETRAAVAKANEGTFDPVDLANGTFTISNVGQFDVQSLAGIVRPEQACLLGLGTIEKKVVPNDDPDAEQIYKYAQVMTATLACDHRVIDGAVGAQWLATFKELVEDPLKMIL